MERDFALDPQLVKDTVPVVDWPLCRVLLMNDAAYPWLVLVPRRDGLRDLDEVAEADLPLLSQEIQRASRALKRTTGAHKMNVAALGNISPQLHIHIIARFTDDAAWPRPIWGVQPAQPYGAQTLIERIGALERALAETA